MNIPIIIRHKGLTTKQRVDMWGRMCSNVSRYWARLSAMASAAFAVTSATTRMSATLPGQAAVVMFLRTPASYKFVLPYARLL